MQNQAQVAKEHKHNRDEFKRAWDKDQRANGGGALVTPEMAYERMKARHERENTAGGALPGRVIQG